MSSLSWSHDRWNAELSRYFFGQIDSPEIVAFCADGPTLAELTGASEDESVASLRSVVAQRVMPGYSFAGVAQDALDWERDGCNGPPPSLALLALTVLAASLMQRGTDVAPHNFYRRFRHLLDPEDDDPGMPGDFGEHIPDLWRQLGWWLNEQLDGACGVLVLPSPEMLEHNPYAKNIAYALQQAVFRASDRRYLYRFFRAIGVDPDDDAEPTELRRALAVWAARHEPATARLHRLAIDQQLEQYSLDLLARLAGSWDGQLFEATSGRPESPIRLRLTTRPLTLSLLASRDDRMPTTTDVRGRADTIALTSSGTWYRPLPLPIEPTEQVLVSGVELDGDKVSLRFEPRSLFALRFSESAGGWVDVDRIQFGELHHLLVRGDVRVEVLSFCERECSEAHLDPAATPKLPSGWFLVRDLRLDRRPSAQPPSELAALIRSGGGPRLRLVGGLKLPHLHNAYLVGGAPFLALPEGIDDRTFTLHKGEAGAHSFTAVGSEFPFAKLRLDAGHYEIKYGPARIAFDLVDGIVETAGEGAGTVVTGAAVVGLHTAGVGPIPASTIAPRPDEICVLLGPTSDDVEVIHTPSWLSEATGEGGLSWINVDSWANFEPVWRLTRPAGRETDYRAERVGSAPPRLTYRGQAWANLILQARLDGADEPTSLLWDEYLDAARTLA